MKASEFVTERLALVLNWYRGMTNAATGMLEHKAHTEHGFTGCGNAWSIPQVASNASSARA